MLGDTLFPLNRLRDLHPDAYTRERAKYEGRRQELLELRIPILDVLWNDALHLAPVHPALLARAWRDEGLPPPFDGRDFFEIPVERLAGKPAAWFARGALPLDDVEPLDAAAYRELEAVPAAYTAYLRGRPTRPFAYLPHVLVAAPIDVAGLRVVRADA